MDLQPFILPDHTMVLPIKPYNQIWALDIHWLPQHFMCDAYKFIDRYHVYRAENISHRQQFLLDIGGHALWDHIGSHGWVSRSKMDYDPTGMMRVHRGGDRIDSVNATLFFNALHDSWLDQTRSFRGEHPPEILKFGFISDFNVSLLESSTFHARNARDQLFEFYRSDILAKSIAYYLADYQLFGMQLPSLVCQYLQFDALLKIMEEISMFNVVHNTTGGQGADGQRLLEKEQELRGKTHGMFGGIFSIYNPLVSTDHRGRKVIQTVDDYNDSIAVKWNRDLWTFETNLDTKIPHFYEMMDFDEMHSDQVLGIKFSGIRGMATLVNVVAMIDAKVWPIGEQCFDLQRFKGNIRDTAHLEMMGVSRVLDSYFRNILPWIMGNATVRVQQSVMRKFVKWTEQEYVVDMNGFDVSKTMAVWLDQDKEMFANIRSWQLYQRDVPRNLFWERRQKFKRYDDPWEI